LELEKVLQNGKYSCEYQRWAKSEKLTPNPDRTRRRRLRIRIRL